MVPPGRARAIAMSCGVADFFEGGDAQQGDLDFALDWRQHSDVSHTQNLRRSRGDVAIEEEGTRYANRRAASNYRRGTT